MPQDLQLGARLDAGREVAQLLEDSLLTNGAVKDYTELYTTGLALQFLSNLKAALSLLEQGTDSEAWIIGRSMAELVIRVKWVHKRRSNAIWMVIGTEQAELNRFLSSKDLSRGRKEAIAALQERLKVLPKLSKKGRYWDKTTPWKVRTLPKILRIAKESGTLNIYRGFFKLGSEHTHASHRVLERFMILDEERNFAGRFSLVPQREDLHFTSYHMLSIAIIFLGLLRKWGWPVSNDRLCAIGNSLISLRPPSLGSI